MNARKTGRSVSAQIWLALSLALSLATAAPAAETDIRLSLDFRFEGPAAPFLLPLDKGYYRAWRRGSLTWASATSIR